MAIRAQRMLRQHQVSDFGPKGVAASSGWENTKCIELDGVGGYLTANGVCADIAGNNYSVSAWIRTTTTAATWFLSFNDSGYGNRTLVGLDSGNIYLYVSGSISTTHRVADGHWHNICLTVDHLAGETKVYVDGVDEINHVVSLDMSASDLFTIGAEWDAGPVVGDFFDGRIDEVACWNKTLSALDVQEIWNNGDATDLSTHTSAANLQGWWTMGDDPLDDATGIFGSIVDQTANGNNATPYGTTNADIKDDSPNETAYQNSLSILLDGVNEYCEVPDNSVFDFYTVTPSATTLPFSVSAWVKTTNAGWQGIISKSDGGPAYTGWQIAHYGTFGLYFSLTNSWNALGLGAYGGALNDGSWHCIAIAYDGSNLVSGITMRIDNVGQALTIYPTNSLSTNDIRNSQDVQIGSAFGDPSSYAWWGSLDEVAVWDKELSSAEMDAIWNSGTPSNLNVHSAQADLLGWWRMGDGDNGAGVFDSADSSDPSARIYNMASATSGSHDALPTNTEAIDIVVGVP